MALPAGFQIDAAPKAATIPQGFEVVSPESEMTAMADSGQPAPVVKDLPFTALYDIFRYGTDPDSMSRGAADLGLTWEAGSNNDMYLKGQQGELYRYNPNSLLAAAASTVRPAAQSVGGIVGGVLAAPETMGVGAIPGMTTGATIGGQLADVAVAPFREIESQRTVGDVAKGAASDVVEQAALSVGGEVVGRALGAGARAVTNVAKKGSTVVSDFVKKYLPAAREIDIAKEPGRVVSAIKSGKVEQLPLKPSSERLAAFDDLELIPNPSMISDNPEYRALEAGIYAKAGSGLYNNEARVLEQVGQRADALRNELGGMTDKSQFNVDFTDLLQGTHREMKSAESAVWNKLRDGVPKTTAVNAGNLRSFIEEEITNLGGEDRLSPQLRRFYKEVTSDKPLTFGLTEQWRKEIGELARKGQGRFKDLTSFQRDGLYSALKADQRATYANAGLDDALGLADAATIKRKSLEESMTKGLGQKLEGQVIDIVGKVETGLTRLTQGDVQSLRTTIGLVPEDQRQAVVASALDGLLMKGARNKGKGVSLTFVDAWDSLNRNKAAKTELFKYIPKEQQQTMENLYQVMKGIKLAKDVQNTSRSANTILNALQTDPTWGSKLYDFGKRAGMAEAATTSIGMPGAGVVMTSIMEARQVGKKAAVEAADELLSSAQFRNAIVKQARKNPSSNSEFIDMPVFQKWYKETPDDTRLTIASRGFLPWLSATSSDSSADEDQGSKKP